MPQVIESTGIQASAICPHCEGEVYSDRLELKNYVIDANGSERPTRLEIRCPHCGKKSNVRIVRY